MKITNVERIAIDLPFANERERRHMQRANTHGERITLWRISTDAGIVGYGDASGNVAQTHDLVGCNVFDVLYSNAVDYGMEIALLDIAGKALEVPVYRLLGDKVRDYTPISWWDIDMPPADWAAECQLALSQGYTSAKLKARPWFDIVGQVDAVSKAVPSWFKLDVDFNSFMINSGNAIPILRELDAFENVAFYESPIWQHDVDGYKQIRSRVKRPISMHWGSPPMPTALCENVCDGYVMGGRLNEMRGNGALLATFNKPFWLQLVGTSIVTAFGVHLCSVLSHAQWPMITCSCLWEDDLLVNPMPVQDGYIRVPEEPGLGIQVDEAAIEKYRVDPASPSPKERYLAKRHVFRVRWPAAPGRSRGMSWCYASRDRHAEAFYSGTVPGFVRGVTLEVLEDDGSAAFTRLYERVQRGDVLE